MFAFILETLAEVRLRRSLLADLRRNLTYILLVDTLYYNSIGIGNVECNTVLFLEGDCMGMTEAENEIFAVLYSLVANTDDYKLLGISVCNALYHVGNECSRESVKRAVFLLVVGACNRDDACVCGYGHVIVNLVCKCSLGTLYGYNIILAESNFNACGN